MTDYHEGFIAGFIPGMLMGLSFMKIAMDHSERKRRGRMRPPQAQWRAEWASMNDDGSVSLGLVRDRNPNPPPGAP